MNQTTLNVFNTVLAARAETAVMEDEMLDHPLYPSFVINLEDTINELLSKGWWFNTVKYKVQPDVFGQIHLPPNALSANPLPSCTDLTFINGVLVNLTTGEAHDQPITLECRVNVDLENLPPTAYQLVKTQTILKCTGQFLSASDVALHAKKEQELQTTLRAEQIVQLGLNRIDSTNIHLQRGHHGHRQW